MQAMNGLRRQVGLQKKTGYLLREWLGDCCPVCKEKLTSHHFARVGVVVKPSEAEASFVQAFRQHRWSGIRIKEFIPILDALLGNVLRCPSGQFAWFITFEPYDLASRHYVAESEVLDPEESRKLDAAVRPEEWRNFPGGFLLEKKILASKLVRVRNRLLERLLRLLRR
jgi:hypothetical protein